jgi:precorrin-2 dehydrogenase/sirohydrochlorin ferrochelatase
MFHLNPLYPIFLKTNRLHFLIVGGGNVALEKLQFLYKSSPNTAVNLIAPFIRSETLEFIQNKEVTVLLKPYEFEDLEGMNIVIACTDNPKLNEQIQLDCRQKGILVNVADSPEWCDFYMGAIVTKGNLKIAISTNGKSPTLAKRIRQFLENILPNEVDDLLDTLQNYKATLKGDFAHKVEKMNSITKSLLP